MKRHGAALVVTAVVAFLSLGSGSRADGGHEPSPESCKTDLGYAFEWCGSQVNWPCRYTFDSYEACQAGCVKYFCPDQISCTELDPIWCEVPCEDPFGATFWYHKHIVDERCGHLSHKDLNGDGHLDSDDRWPLYDCNDAEHKKLCPAYRTWREEAKEREARRLGVSPEDIYIGPGMR